METVGGDNEDEDNEGGDEADAVGNDLDEVDVDATFLGGVSEEEDFACKTGDDISDDEGDGDDNNGDMLGHLLGEPDFHLSRDVLLLFISLSGDECDATL